MKHSISHQEYFKYLSKRSILGVLYRRYRLYPMLCRYLKGNVLDYGCGIGDFLKYHENSIGIDINQYNIDYCTSHGLNAKLIENNEIPFENNSFSSIIMDNVIEHIASDNINSVIIEISRVLKPGGNLLIGVPGLKGYRADDDHKCFYTDEDLASLLNKYHYKNIKTIHMPIYLPWLQSRITQYCIYSLFIKS